MRSASKVTERETRQIPAEADGPCGQHRVLALLVTPLAPQSNPQRLLHVAGHPDPESRKATLIYPNVEAGRWDTKAQAIP